mgnify:CR=1 FL=1
MDAQSTEIVRTCGTCRHFRRAKTSSIGSCEAPVRAVDLPISATITRLVIRDETNATLCRCWEERCDGGAS